MQEHSRTTKTVQVLSVQGTSKPKPVRHITTHIRILSVPPKEMFTCTVANLTSLSTIPKQQRTYSRDKETTHVLKQETLHVLTSRKNKQCQTRTQMSQTHDKRHSVLTQRKRRCTRSRKNEQCQTKVTCGRSLGLADRIPGTLFAIFPIGNFLIKSCSTLLYTHTHTHTLMQRCEMNVMLMLLCMNGSCGADEDVVGVDGAVVVMVLMVV